MGRIIGFLYGLVAYLVFLGAFLYAIGFVTGLWVPKTIDSGPAASTVEALALDGLGRHQLALQVFETALRLVTSRTLPPAASVKVLGQPLEERSLRLGLEHTLRTLAHLSVGAEKIRLVDEANRVRPRTLF